MSTAMDKPLNGAGLAVVNQIFNERLSRLEGGGGVDWAETPFTGMTHFNNSSAFGCAWLETEKISSMARIIRGVAVLQVKAASWSGSQTLKVSLPGAPFRSVVHSIPSSTTGKQAFVPLSFPIKSSTLIAAASFLYEFSV